MRPAQVTYRWRPLRTARLRWLVDQTWTKLGLGQAVRSNFGTQGPWHAEVDELGKHAHWLLVAAVLCNVSFDRRRQ